MKLFLKAILFSLLSVLAVPASAYIFLNKYPHLFVKVSTGSNTFTISYGQCVGSSHNPGLIKVKFFLPSKYDKYNLPSGTNCTQIADREKYCSVQLAVPTHYMDIIEVTSDTVYLGAANQYGQKNCSHVYWY